MSNFSEVDPNFKLDTELDKADIRFYNVLQAPFRVYGLLYENGVFCRLPEQVAHDAEAEYEQWDGVHRLYACGAGGRVRFATDSPYIAIHAVMPEMNHMQHFAFAGSAGFDLYANIDGEERYIKTYVPYTSEGGYESVIDLEDATLREYTIHFPLYSVVSELYIGVADTARVEAASEYRISKPIVYYGSSITQGGCASRPGNAYSNILSRRLNADQINLGFSGNAKGEQPVARYIASLEMSAFVLDYDHNAFDAAHLRKTHAAFFSTVRAAHPDLPVVMCTRPKWYLTEEEVERRSIVEETYRNALANGDRNVYFVDGRQLMALCGNEGTVDGCHPTDYGFYSMAQAIGEVLEKVL